MIGLVYLVWAPLGPGPVRAFLDSYLGHPAGTEHELLIVLNGAGDMVGVDGTVGADGTVRVDGTVGADGTVRVDGTVGADGAGGAEGSDRAGGVYGADDVDAGALGVRARLTEQLQGVPHRLLFLEQPVLDLAAYGLAARHWQHERLCFCNSYSVVLADGWLGKLAGALDDPGVGVAGASGSWESQAEWRRGKARYWGYQLARLRAGRRDYPRFPNPHIRTTGFALRRETALALGLDRALDKRDTYLLESGHRSITRQLLDRGQRAVVVDRDGTLYETDDWGHSHTYRSGDQRGLLLADRRSEDWQRASPRLRRRLSRDAWGGGL